MTLTTPNRAYSQSSSRAILLSSSIPTYASALIFTLVPNHGVPVLACQSSLEFLLPGQTQEQPCCNCGFVIAELCEPEGVDIGASHVVCASLVSVQCSKLSLRYTSESREARAKSPNRKLLRKGCAQL
jgi:hypothetical protein